MSNKTKHKAGGVADRLEEAMKRYAELEGKVQRFKPRRRFIVVPTADKWSSDVALIELGAKSAKPPAAPQPTRPGS